MGGSKFDKQLSNHGFLRPSLLDEISKVTSRQNEYVSFSPIAFHVKRWHWGENKARQIIRWLGIECNFPRERLLFGWSSGFKTIKEATESFEDLAVAFTKAGGTFEDYRAALVATQREIDQFVNREMKDVNREMKKLCCDDQAAGK